MFNDFKPVSKIEWKNKVLGELGNNDFESLLWNSNGLIMEPYYSNEDLKKIEYRESYFKKYEEGFINYAWIQVTDEDSAGKAGTDALKSGAGGLLFQINSFPELDNLLKDILPEFCHITFESNLPPEQFLKDYFDYISSKKYDPKKIHGSLVGNIKFKTERNDSVVHLLKEAKDFDNFFACSIEIPSENLNTIESLATALGMLVDLVDDLGEKGIQPEHILRKVQFKVSVGTNYFLEISKLRSLRTLYSMLLSAYNITSNFQPYIFCISEKWENKSLEPNENMLKGSTAAMAAIIGGCDAICIEPQSHDDKLSLRIAKNTPLILKEEAFLDKVVDPAKGSYFIETMTNRIVTDSWNILNKIEEEGGLRNLDRLEMLKDISESVINEK